MACGIVLPQRPVTRDHAVVLLEPDGYLAAIERVVAALRNPGAYTVMPLVVADADDPGLRGLSEIPGVIGVSEQVDGLQVGMLDGTNWIIAGGLGFLDAWARGGVSEPAEYPTIGGEPIGELAPPAVCAAANFSLAPEHDDTVETLNTDVVNHATRALSEVAVPVVASGNHHTLGVEYETLSPWAEPDWVLSVGATDDEDASTEWAKSGRGGPLAPELGPDLLTWGQDLTDPECFGTSFAAAQTTFMVALCRAWLLQVAANIDRRRGRSFGVPLVGVAFVDRGRRRAGVPPNDFPWGALPIFGTTEAAFVSIDEPVQDAVATEISGWGGVRYSRRLLEAAAKATSTSIGLSAPSINLARLELFLDDLAFEQLVRMIAIPLAGARPTAEVGQPLFTTGTAHRLAACVRESMPVWSWDIDTGEHGVSH